MTDTQWNRYQVFVQESEGKPHLDYGSVHAPDPELALLNARDVFARRPDCVSMWVVPVEAIYSNTAEELQARKVIPTARSGYRRGTLFYFCQMAANRDDELCRGNTPPVHRMRRWKKNSPSQKKWNLRWSGGHFLLARW